MEMLTIQCHRPGGFALGGVVLKYGRNEVPADAWSAALGSLHQKLADALLYSSTPDIVVHRPEPTQPALPLDAGTAEAVELLARDKIAIIEAATEPDELERLADGETRKTVLAAIQKRAKALAEAA
jgi:hypothetical protein